MTAKTLIQEETSAAEGIIRVLEEAGIDIVFGMSGGNVKYLFDALYDRKSSIRTVLVRHESLAGIMAEVYGRLTGRPGVAIGQGAFVLSNALLGALEAHLGCSPMLMMADLSDNAPFSQHAPYQAGTGEYGTWDAKQSFSGVTKSTFVLYEPIQAVQGTQLAIKHAMSGERGPVAVIYHSAAFKQGLTPEGIPLVFPTKHYLSKQPLAAAEGEIVASAEVLLGAERPLIIAGNGVRISKGFKELKELSELLGAPVATTAAGKGVFAEDNDLALGVFGTFGTSVANSVIAEANVILFVGTKVSPTDTAKENPKLLDPRRQTFIQIEIEPKNASWTFPCENVLIGDASVAMSQLCQAIQDVGRPSLAAIKKRKEELAAARKEFGFFDGSGFFSEEVPILPERAIWEIRQAVNDDALIACDAGENRLFMTHFFQTRSADSFISPASIGGMGYAIPAALAGKLIYPDRQVIAVCGDGGFGMAMNGLITAYEENIQIVTVILNNRALGWVRHGQGERPIASEFKDVNYAAVAEALGGRGFRVEDPSQLSHALHAALRSEVPATVDVAISMKTTFRDVTSPLALW